MGASTTSSPRQWQVKKPAKQQLWLALSCVVCASIALRLMDGGEGAEFTGGRATGPLLTMSDAGTLLFMLNFVVALALARVGAIIGIAASLLCLPLSLFFIAPIAFARIFASERFYKAQPVGGVHFYLLPVAETLMLGVTIYVCVRILIDFGAALSAKRGN